MAELMRILRSNFRTAVIFFALPVLFAPWPARAQSTGDAPAPQHPADSPAATSQPSAKKRLSKDFTLEGDSAWTDTGIDLQPGEKIVVTASGKLRYADA